MKTYIENGSATLGRTRLSNTQAARGRHVGKCAITSDVVDLTPRVVRRGASYILGEFRH